MKAGKLLETSLLAFSPQQPMRHRRPPRWGSSVPALQNHAQQSGVRYFCNKSTTNNDDDRDQVMNMNKDIKEEDEREDCPLCRKYGRGPCGNIFKQWLSCTDSYRGAVHPKTGEDLHLTKCSDLAGKLAHCLDAHMEYYKKADEDEDEEVKQAWSEFVNDFKKNYLNNNFKDGKTIVIDISKQGFIRPKGLVLKGVTIEMQVRLESQSGVAKFEAKQKNDDDTHLLCVFVEDENNTLLGAVSAEELEQHDGTLRFKLHSKSQTIRANALFEKENDNQFILVQKTQQLPPR